MKALLKPVFPRQLDWA